MPNKNANTTGPKNLIEVAQGKWEHLMPKKQMFLTPRVVEVDESPENFRRRMNSKRPNDRKHGYGSLTMQVKDSPQAVSGGKLNPMWVEWLMGWTLGWTDLKPLAMDKSHCAQPQHGES